MEKKYFDLAECWIVLTFALGNKYPKVSGVYDQRNFAREMAAVEKKLRCGKIRTRIVYSVCFTRDSFRKDLRNIKETAR
jgi:hypothetical protein